jgi:hypothetical protein
MITSSLDRAEEVYVRYLARGLDAELDRDQYIKQFNLTSPVVVAPKVLDRTRSFALTWTQPLLESFYTEWWDDDIRPRDAAGFEGSKAVMTVAAGMRASSHILNACDDLAHKPALWSLFSQLGAERHHGFALRHNSNLTRHLPRLAAVVNERAPRYLARIVQELAELFPEAPIGRFLSADANRAAAWTQQRSGKRHGKLDPELEQWLRRRVPQAAYRYYGPGNHRSEEADEETMRTVRPGGRGTRGYLIHGVTEIATQIPLALRLVPADSYEPDAADDLMRTVFESWSDIPATYLVADKKWHDRRAHEHLMRSWDIRLVAITPKHRLERATELSWRAHPSAGTILGNGIVLCQAHQKPCRFERIETPNRKTREMLGLSIGEAADAGKFRYRVVCDHGCGRLNLPMALDWSALSALPNHGHGRPDQYALRVALEAHRNISEAGFSSLEVAHKLLGKDGARSRLLDKDVNEALVWLALLTKAGALLAAELIHRGLVSADLIDERLGLTAAA